MIYLDVDTAVAVPVNIMPLTDDSDFKTRETAVAYNASGMDLVWNFVTSAGVMTQTAVTPTTSGVYDWTHVGDGMYKIEIPASGGASINNNTPGFGWFSGVCTGVLPWVSPIYCFRAAGINDKLCDSAYSATRGLSGTALPDAAADAAGGLPISDAGGLPLDELLTKIRLLFSAEGTVSNPGSGTATVFNTDLTEQDDTFNDQLLLITTGALTGQIKPILDYDQTNGQITLEEGFTDAPSNGVEFVILAFHAHPVSQIQSGLATASAVQDVQDAVDGFTDHKGTAQAGAAGSITLASSASSDDDYYNKAVVKIISGTGAGQSRQITDYVGSTRVATVDTNWVTNPDNTSVYQVLGRIV